MRTADNRRTAVATLRQNPARDGPGSMLELVMPGPDQEQPPRAESVPLLCGMGFRTVGRRFCQSWAPVCRSWARGSQWMARVCPMWPQVCNLRMGRLQACPHDRATVSRRLEKLDARHVHEAADGYAIGIGIGDRDPARADGQALGMPHVMPLAAGEVDRKRLERLPPEHFANRIGMHCKAPQ
jgi:hypothetical protein